MAHSVLIVTTSTGRAGEDGPETGFDWISVSAPYWRLHQAGVRIGFASIRGGKPPGDPATAIDPGTGERAGPVNMFLGSGAAVDALAHSNAIDTIDPALWDAIVITDGLGGLWDLASSAVLADLVAAFWQKEALVAAIGAGVTPLANVRDADNRALVAGRRMTCLADAAIAARGIDPPVSPESLLRAAGADLWVSSSGGDPAVVEEGRLITGEDARVAAELSLQLLDALDTTNKGARRDDVATASAPHVAPEPGDTGMPATSAAPPDP